MSTEFRKDPNRTDAYHGVKVCCLCGGALILSGQAAPSAHWASGPIDSTYQCLWCSAEYKGSGNALILARANSPVFGPDLMQDNKRIWAAINTLLQRVCELQNDVDCLKTVPNLDAGIEDVRERIEKFLLDEDK